MRPVSSLHQLQQKRGLQRRRMSNFLRFGRSGRVREEEKEEGQEEGQEEGLEGGLEEAYLACVLQLGEEECQLLH